MAPSRREMQSVTQSRKIPPTPLDLTEKGQRKKNRPPSSVSTSHWQNPTRSQSSREILMQMMKVSFSASRAGGRRGGGCRGADGEYLALPSLPRHTLLSLNVWENGLGPRHHRIYRAVRGRKNQQVHTQVNLAKHPKETMGTMRSKVSTLFLGFFTTIDLQCCANFCSTAK